VRIEEVSKFAKNTELDIKLKLQAMGHNDNFMNLLGQGGADEERVKELEVQLQKAAFETE